jgi:O-antigen/teichoic acid export membrane protein
MAGPDRMRATRTGVRSLLIRTRRVAAYPGRGFTWSLSGNMVYSLCQWSFVVVLAKLGTVEDVGGYALGLAITSPLLIFANFQTRNLVASDVRNEHSFAEYLSFRVASLVLALMVLLGIIFFTGHWGSTPSVIFLLGLGQAFDWASETYFGLLQKHDRLDLVAQSLMLKGPLCLLLLTAVMYSTQSLVWAVASLALGRGLILWCFDSKKANRIAGPVRMTWNRITQARLLRLALPLGVISGLVALNFNIPRYFIESDLSKRDLGIFSAIASLVGIGNLFMAALASCSFVAIAKAHAACDTREYRSLSLRLFGLGAILGGAGVLAAAVAGDRILTLLFRPEYGGSAGVFTRIMLVGALGYIISGQGYAMTAARKVMPQIPALLCTAGATTLFSWRLVPTRGLEGAAEAWLLGSLVQLTWSSLIMARIRSGEAVSRSGAPEHMTVPLNAG